MESRLQEFQSRLQVFQSRLQEFQSRLPQSKTVRRLEWDVPEPTPPQCESTPQVRESSPMLPSRLSQGFTKIGNLGITM